MQSPTNNDKDTIVTIDDCHSNHSDDKPTTGKSPVKKLIIAAIICFIFMLAEVAGGFISGSIALLSDAVHMLTDLLGLILSLVFSILARRKAAEAYTYGYHRATIIGALTSVLLLWIFTGILVYQAVERINKPEDIDAPVMFGTGLAGLIVNLVMIKVLHGGDGHSHGHSHGHEGHSHNEKKKTASDKTHKHEHHDHEHNNEHNHDHNHEHQDHIHEHNHSAEKIIPEMPTIEEKNMKSKGHDENLRAALLHVLGDALQSVGVVIAAILIWISEDLAIADPICTFIFAVIILFSSKPVIQDCVKVLMEASPKHIDLKLLNKEISEIEGVTDVHDLHVWCITSNKFALTVHLKTNKPSQEILLEALKITKSVGITHPTIQIEDEYDDKHPLYIKCSQNIH